MRAQAGRTALARLVGPARAVPTLQLVGAVELTVAAALLTSPMGGAGLLASPVGGVAATLLSLGFLAYLGYSYVSAPAASCGCLGAHSQPVNWRAFARAGLLLAASVAAIWAGPHPVDPPVVALGLVEVAALAGLSAELDRHWLHPLRQLLVRLRKPLAVRSEDVPLGASLHLLYRSPAYCSASAHLTSDVQDEWDEDGLRFVTFAAGERTAVFAIPLSGDGDVRVALTV
jgi:hypothetical protein